MIEYATLAERERRECDALIDNGMSTEDALNEIEKRRNPWYHQGTVYEPSQLRRLLIARLEDAEVELSRAQEALDVKAREYAQAEAARDLAYEHRQQRRATVKNLRAEVLRRFPEPAE